MSHGDQDKSKPTRELVRYGITGIVTTVVNIVVFAALQAHGAHTVPATLLAWIASVAFSFAASKIYVYRSHSLDPELTFREAAKFVSGRAATGALDVAAMWFLCDILSLPSLVCKVAVNVVVIAGNYILGKLAFATAQGR